MDTQQLDWHRHPIKEGDILAGKTDQLHPMGERGLYERDIVRLHPMINNPLIASKGVQGWFWNGFLLDTVAKNCVIIGNIWKNPELLLYKKL